MSLPKQKVALVSYDGHRASMRECGYDPYNTADDLRQRIEDEEWWASAIEDDGSYVIESTADEWEVIQCDEENC